MMARKSKRAKAKPTPRMRPRRISRSMMAELLTDLCSRLEKQVWVAEAIAKVGAPTGDTIMRAWPMAKVIELAVTAHLSDLREVKEFAQLMNGKVTP